MTKTYFRFHVIETLTVEVKLPDGFDQDDTHENLDMVKAVRDYMDHLYIVDEYDCEVSENDEPDHHLTYEPKTHEVSDD